MRKSNFIAAVTLAIAGLTVTSASANTVTLDMTKSYTNGSFTMRLDGGSDPAFDFLAWCLDESARLDRVDGEYEVKFKTFPNTIFDDKKISDDNLNKIQSLFDVYGDNYNSATSTKGQKRDFSDALWALADGKTNIRSGAQTLLDGLVNDDTNVDKYFLVFFDAGQRGDGSQASQNLVAGFLGTTPFIETTPVPLPAGAWMLFAGIGGLGVIGRRRRRTEA